MKIKERRKFKGECIMTIGAKSQVLTTVKEKTNFQGPR